MSELPIVVQVDEDASWKMNGDRITWHVEYKVYLSWREYESSNSPSIIDIRQTGLENIIPIRKIDTKLKILVGNMCKPWAINTVEIECDVIRRRVLPRTEELRVRHDVGASVPTSR